VALQCRCDVQCFVSAIGLRRARQHHCHSERNEWIRKHIVGSCNDNSNEHHLSVRHPDTDGPADTVPDYSTDKRHQCHGYYIFNGHCDSECLERLHEHSFDGRMVHYYLDHRRCRHELSQCDSV